MSIDQIKEAVQDYAKDLRINISQVLTPEGSPGLSEQQIFGSALSVAMAIKQQFLIEKLRSASKDILSEQDIKGIKTAVSLMGMNNVYYRTLHLSGDEELSKRPARMRMTMMRNHGLDQKDFEIYSLAISSLSGCEMCIKSHTAKLKEEGLSVEALQSIIRISAVVHGVSQSLNL